MADKDANQAVAVQRFWDAFKACLEENRVRPDRSDFNVKWVQAFVDFRPGKKLRGLILMYVISQIMKCLILLDTFS